MTGHAGLASKSPPRIPSCGAGQRSQGQRAAFFGAAETCPAPARHQPPTNRKDTGMQPAEQSARMARPAGQATPEIDLGIAAAAIARHIADRDEGAIRNLIHGLEHKTGPWSVDPWRLVEHLAVNAIEQRG